MKRPTTKIAMLILLCIVVLIFTTCNFYLPPSGFTGPFPDPTPTAVPGAGVTPTANPTLQPDGNMIYNGDFSNGLANWGNWVNTGMGANATVTNAGGYLAVTIVDGRDTFWYIQVTQVNLVLVTNKKYTLSFRAWAEAARIITMDLSENGRDNNGDSSNYTSYDANSASLGSAPADYVMDFYMYEVTDNQARLVFNLGANNGDVFIDNVRLIESDI